jgi:hypothetical protein
MRRVVNISDRTRKVVFDSAAFRYDNSGRVTLNTDGVTITTGTGSSGGGGSGAGGGITVINDGIIPGSNGTKRFYSSDGGATWVVQNLVGGIWITDAKPIHYKTIAGEGIDVTIIPPVQYAVTAGIADIDELRTII